MNTIIDTLDSLDKQLIVWLNGNGDPYWDTFFWVYSGRFIWIPVGLAFVFYFFQKGGWLRGLLTLLTIVALIALCDRISSGFFKPTFERLRPARNPDLEPLLTIVNGYRGSRFGFVSSHAANSFGFATFMALLVRRRLLTVSLMLWAVVNCYSRIYLGVHYPGDILCGALLGTSLAFAMYAVHRAMVRMVENRTVLRIAGHDGQWVGSQVSLGESVGSNPYRGVPQVLTLGVLFATWVVIMILPLCGTFWWLK